MRISIPETLAADLDVTLLAQGQNERTKYLAGVILPNKSRSCIK